MLSKIAKFCIIFALVFYLFKWLFLWLFETTDTFFYWEFAEFIKTGKYFAPHPYYWTTPTTFSAPLYSVFLYFIQLVKRADIFIHLFQITGLIFSAFLVYKIIKTFIPKEIALILTSIYLFIPANIFQTSGVMTEAFSLTAISIYLYIFFEILVEKKTFLLKYLVFYSSVIILLRYNFICFFVLAILMLLFIDIKKFKKIQSGVFMDCIFILASFSVIGSWVLTNHQITGSWGLSDAVGKNLYSRVVGGDRLLPPENDPNWLRLKEITENNPYWLRFLKTTGRTHDLFHPSYEIEPYILPNFEGSVVKESNFLAAIAHAAIKNHPLEYLRNTIMNLLVIHGNGMPYAKNLYTHSELANCRTLGNISFCKGIISSSYAAPLWNLLVKLAENYYYNIPFHLNWFLLLPSLIFSLIQKNKFIKFAAIVYLTAVLTVVIPEVPVFRYLYPLYPVKIVLVTYFVSQIVKQLKKTVPQCFKATDNFLSPSISTKA